MNTLKVFLICTLFTTSALSWAQGYQTTRSKRTSSKIKSDIRYLEVATQKVQIGYNSGHNKVLFHRLTDKENGVVCYVTHSITEGDLMSKRISTINSMNPSISCLKL